MANTVEHPARKSRLSLSLKRSNDQAIAIKNLESDNSENLNELNTSKEAPATSINNKSPSNSGDEEEEIIPCSETEDSLVFSQKSVPSSNCDKSPASIVSEQKIENYSFTETCFPNSSLEHDQSKDSSIKEDEVNNFEDESSTDIFNSPEAKVSKILNKIKDGINTEELATDINEKVISNNSNSENTSSKVECLNINAETNIQEECNEIPNSPEANIFKIIKDNELETEESKCYEKKYDQSPIVKRNVIIADSDEEFEEFANPKRKSQKKTESTNTSNSQKENSTSKTKEQTKVSSRSSKEKSKALKSHQDKDNVSKTSKKKNLPLKRKLESVAENSEDEFEKPSKQAKKIETPQRESTNKEVKKSKKLKKTQKSL